MKKALGEKLRRYEFNSWLKELGSDDSGGTEVAESRLRDHHQ